MRNIVKLSLALSVVLALMSNAYATSINPSVTNNTYNDQTYNQGGSASAVATSTIQKGAVQNYVDTNVKNSNSNKQGQLQGQQQQVTDSNNAAQSVSIGGDVTTLPRIPVSTAYAPNVAPTAPCMGSSSAGAQGLSVGFSFGTSWTSEECLILETARNFSQAGSEKDAMTIRCQAKYAKNAPSCKALNESTNTKGKSAEIETPTKVVQVQPSPVIKANNLPVIDNSNHFSKVSAIVGH